MNLILLLLACGAPVEPVAAPVVAAPPSPSSVAEAEDIDPIVAAMRRQPLDYTRHARCRMDCRKIDEAEVSAILEADGVLKPERSRQDGECPTHALEGETRDGQTVRVVYAACSDETRVVTVIDLDTDWPCGDC